MKNLTFRHEPMCDFFDKYHIDGLTDKDGKPIRAVLHHFKDADHGDPHDHPFGFTSHILHGSYTEIIYHILPSGKIKECVKTRHAGTSHFVFSKTIHQIIEVSEGGFHSIITPQEKVQESSFYRFEDGKVFKRQWNESEFKELIIK